MKYWLPAFVFAALVAGSGVLHGIRTERWKPTPGLDEAVQRLEGVPLELGDWQGERLYMEPTDLARAGIKGHFYCRYTDARTRRVVSVLVVCGRSGPISVHTPDVCYEAAGYESLGPADLNDIPLSDTVSVKFADMSFRKPNSRSAAKLAILWAWNGGDGWTAAENPRLVFARYPILYKLYIIRETSKFEQGDQTTEFLRKLLPELDRALYSKPVS